MSEPAPALQAGAPDGLRLRSGRTGDDRFNFRIALVALVGLPASYYLARLLVPGSDWWPFPDPTVARSPVLVALLLSVGALTVALPSWRWKVKLKTALERRIGRRASHGVERLALLICAGLLLHRWQHARGPMGDLRTWLRLAPNPFIQGSEPLGRWMHYFAHRLLGLFGPHPDPMLALRLPSYAAGVFLLYCTIRFLPEVVPREKVAPAAVFLLGAPFSIFFFGYPATSPWAYAFLGAYLLAGLRYLALKPNRPPWPESLLIALAVWTHGMALFATGAQAALVALWFWGWPAEGGRAKPMRLLTAAGLSLAPFVLLGATLWWARTFGTGLGEAPWMGTAAGGIFHRTWILFSGQDQILNLASGERFEEYLFLGHDYDWGRLNLFLWMCPGLVLIPMATWQLARSRAKEVAFLLSAMVGLLLLTLFWNPDNGHEGDMRLLSLFAVPAYLLLLLWLARVLDGRRLKLLVTLGVSATFAFTLVPYLRFP